MPDRILESERPTDAQKYEAVRREIGGVYGLPNPPVVEEGEVLEGQRFPPRSVVDNSESSPFTKDRNDNGREIISGDVAFLPSRIIPFSLNRSEYSGLAKKLVDLRIRSKAQKKTA